MNLQIIFQKSENQEFLSVAEALYLFDHAPLGLLMYQAHKQRLYKKNDPVVTWLIDRNANITNVCNALCTFCNFYRKAGDSEAYVTTIDEYIKKIDEMYAIGGRQLLLQGGLNPKLKINFYEDLFRQLKSLYPDLKLHSLGTAEIVHLSRMDNLSYSQTLERLQKAGLDSLPGAGAEILSDRVRKTLSKGKCNTQEWLDVMRAAHKQYMITSATMMYGHIETLEERMVHLELIRTVQAEKPKDAPGFLAFIPWTFQDENTELRTKSGIEQNRSGEEYIRMIAISRLMLPNIDNIQASWLTVGKEIGQVCLYAGANDFGSIMIEENVVSAAGAPYRMDKEGIQKSIKEAGYQPRQRNQKYEYID